MALRDMIPFRRQAPVRTTDDQVRSFQQEMNRLFDDFWGAWPRFGGLFRSDERMSERLGAFVPNVELSEGKDTVEVTAELPGMKEEDIELTLSPNADRLVLRGEKKLEEEKREHDFYRCERAYGSFQRVIDLPVSVDVDKVEAKFENGVLSVHLPKQPGATGSSRAIPISK